MSRVLLTAPSWILTGSSLLSTTLLQMNPLIDFLPHQGAIKDMPAVALNTVLRALGMETNGGLEQKKAEAEGAN
jgi:hypothetical protein